MSKYIDAKKLKEKIDEIRQDWIGNSTGLEVGELGAELGAAESILDSIDETITSLQQEQPMPNSTELIAKWEEEKDVLKQMDFRGDEWRLAQNAFMDGFGTGLSVKQEQLDKYETALEKAREWMPNVNQGGHAILIDIFPELGEGLDPRYVGRKQEQPEVQNEKFIFPKYLYARTKDNKTIDMSYAPQDMTAVEYIKNDPTEQPEVDLAKELDRYLRGEFQQTAGGNFNNYIQIARHFYKLGLNTRKK